MSKKVISMILAFIILFNSISAFALNEETELTDEEIIEACRHELQEYLDKGEFDLLGQESGKILEKYYKLYGAKNNPKRCMELDKAISDLQFKIALKTLDDNGEIYAGILLVVAGGVLGAVKIAENQQLKEQLATKYQQVLAEGNIIKIIDFEQKMEKALQKKPLLTKTQKKGLGDLFVNTLKAIFK